MTLKDIISHMGEMKIIWNAEHIQNVIYLLKNRFPALFSEYTFDTLNEKPWCNDLAVEMCELEIDKIVELSRDYKIATVNGSNSDKKELKLFEKAALAVFMYLTKAGNEKFVYNEEQLQVVKDEIEKESTRAYQNQVYAMKNDDCGRVDVKVTKESCKACAESLIK